MARVVWKSRFIRSDWWLFSLFVLSAAIACAAFGWSLRKDERAAARARTEHVARSLALDLLRLAVSPGSDFAGTLPQLAEAAGPEVSLAVVDVPDGEVPTFGHARFMGHSDPAREGGLLDATRAEDRRLLALVLQSHGPGKSNEPDILWNDNHTRVSATMAGPPGAGVWVVVQNVDAPAPAPRPTLIALVAFAMIVLFAAGLHDVLMRAGPYWNVLVLAVGCAAVALLGHALEPSLFRGVPTELLVRRAESLNLAELARTLAADLPVPPSYVDRYGVPVAGAAFAFYLLALAGLWHRAGRAVKRDAFAFELAGPAIVAGSVLVVLPLIAGASLAFFRATPAEVGFVGGANFEVIAGPGSFESPLGVWQPLVWTVLVVGLSTVLQLVGGRLGASLLRQVPARARPVWSALLLVPWALPLYAAVLVWKGGVDLGFLGHLPAALSGALAAVATSVWIGVPVAAILIEQAYATVPAELEEAAQLEGLGAVERARLFAGMIEPGLRGAAWVAAILGFGASTLAQLASAPGDAGSDMLATRGARWALERFEFGQAAAFALVAFAFALVVTLVLAGRARALE